MSWQVLACHGTLATVQLPMDSHEATSSYVRTNFIYTHGGLCTGLVNILLCPWDCHIVLSFYMLRPQYANSGQNLNSSAEQGVIDGGTHNVGL